MTRGSSPPPASASTGPLSFPDEVDVLIVGSGPAGMLAAAQLSQFPDVTTRIVERRAGRLAIGQADGIQARSVETFQAFGFAERIIAEAYRITEMAFWKPDPADPSRIVRAARTPDDPAGISEFPHLIVNQARVLDYFAEFMANSPTRMTPDYGFEFRGLEVAGEGEYPVTVTLLHTVRPRRGPGAHRPGQVRRRRRRRPQQGARVDRLHPGRRPGQPRLGRHGRPRRRRTSPTSALKCAIQSGTGGSILLIPREGGHLFRMYVDLGEVDPNDNGAVRNTTIEEIIAKANEILHPYTLDVRNVAWHSVYEVGHRLTDRFDDVLPEERGTRTPRVFITGDACHTHSAKAGQGMNVSMQDGFNIALEARPRPRGPQPGSPALHLLGRAPGGREEPHRLRQGVVHPHGEEARGVRGPLRARGLLRQHRRVPRRLHDRVRAVHAGGAEPTHQDLATGFPVGKRFKSAPVVRVGDTNPVHLGHHATADGRWRIYVFADAATPQARAAGRRPRVRRVDRELAGIAAGRHAVGRRS